MALRMLSIGEASIDAYLDKKLSKVTTHFAGSASNSAKNYASLGMLSKARIWLAKDAQGKMIEENLLFNDVTVVSTVTPNIATPHTLYLSGKHTKLVQLTDQTKKMHEVMMYKDVPMIRSANWIHLSDLNCAPHSITKIFDEAYKTVAIPLTWTPGSRQIADGFHAFPHLLEHTVVLTLNHEELLKFTNRRNRDYAIKDLLHAGVKVLVITNHDHVVRVVTKTEMFTIAAPHGKHTDHTGAGMRWASTFTYFLATQFDVVKAMQMATFHTHLLMTQEGADSSLMTAADLEKKFTKEKKNYLVHIHDYR